MLNNLFKSTTLRLTGWYVLILMTISIMFSLAIYKIATAEVGSRLEKFQNSIEQTPNIMPRQMLGLEYRNNQLKESAENISVELLYANLFVLIAGGFASYYLARRNLVPIEKAHEAQSRFTSDASHELRTPLAVMKMELELALRDKNATNTELKEILSSNLEEVNKLSKLSEMLLSLSNYDNNKLDKNKIDLGKISSSTIGSFKLPKSRLQIKSQKNIYIKANETAISELIKILTDNAIQYSPSNSLVYIDVSKTDNRAKFEITNTGAGISPEKLPHIFERFYRADSSRTNGPKKGYGLGLALAKSIIEIHNGEIIATSEPDHATTFTFLIDLSTKNKQKSRNS